MLAEGRQAGGAQRALSLERRCCRTDIVCTYPDASSTFPRAASAAAAAATAAAAAAAAACCNMVLGWVTRQEPGGGDVVPEGQLHHALHPRGGEEAGLPLQRVDTPALYLDQRKYAASLFREIVSFGAICSGSMFG